MNTCTHPNTVGRVTRENTIDVFNGVCLDCGKVIKLPKQWLIDVNSKDEYAFTVQSGKSLYDKWDRIQAKKSKCKKTGKRHAVTGRPMP